MPSNRVSLSRKRSDTERGLARFSARETSTRVQEKKKMKRTVMQTFALKVIISMIAATVSAANQPLQGQEQRPSVADEVKVAPGAIHMVWKGKETIEPEISAMVDKQKVFNMENASHDPSVKAVANRTSRWTGILNLPEPGLYTFNMVYRGCGRDSTMELSINGTSIMSGAYQNTGSKNVYIPGPANIEVTMYSPAAHMGNHVLLRYKKAGTLDYTLITPETLYHAIK